MDKILITGAGGFIGSHLVELMVNKGYNVRAFLRYNSNNSWGWLDNSHVKNEIEIVRGDIRDYDSVYRAVKGCHSVFHLAALIGIPYSYNSPLAYIKTNIEGTYNILEASRIENINDVIITSTSETYGSAQYVPIDESHPLVGQSPYSASKISADKLAESYHLSFGVPVKIIRPFNTYGPRQSGRAIIPSIILQLLKGKERINIGNIFPVRDFTYVKDTVKGFLKIYSSKKLVGETVNIGMGKGYSIKDLIDIISGLMEVNIRTKNDKKRIRPDKSEVNKLICKNRKLMKVTDWRPEYNIQKGLKETIIWFKENIGKFKPDIYNI